MKFRTWKSFINVAVMIVAAAILLSLVQLSAFAQVRPALVKNTDEPGRTPWETRSQLLPNAGGCYGTSDCYNYSDGPAYAVFDLKPVPAGKRWVITSATAGFAFGTSRTSTTIELDNVRGGITFDGIKWTYGGPFYPYGSSHLTFSTNMFAVLGPGETPTVRIYGAPNLSGYTVVVFSGYLIDATN